MEEKINSHGKTAKIAGTLFMIATVAGILSVFGTAPLHTADYLVNIAANTNQVITGAVLVLIMGIAIAFIPVVLFPILKKHNEVLALGYILFRTLEVVTFLAIVFSFLLLLTLSREYVHVEAVNVAHYQTLGTVLLAAVDWTNLLTVIVFSLSALILNYIFYRSRLIPRWLSVWGLIGAILHLAGGLLGMFDFGQVGFLAAPIALQEMVYALRLIVKGFDLSAIPSESVKQL